VPDWDRYTTVYIGYPIWWGVAAWPVDTFVRANDFSGKTVIPFCTSASSPLGSSADELAKLANGGDWKAGQRFGSSADAADVKAWVKQQS
ncbi:MAG: flavodoxin, partial [Bifidobacterium castoris]|nr:flavodoxin [Bifidobacterium castoris]